jgi:hypothetical protein
MDRPIEQNTGEGQEFVQSTTSDLMDKLLALELKYKQCIDMLNTPPKLDKEIGQLVRKDYNQTRKEKAEIAREGAEILIQLEPLLVNDPVNSRLLNDWLMNKPAIAEFDSLLRKRPPASKPQTEVSEGTLQAEVPEKTNVDLNLMGIGVVEKEEEKVKKTKWPDRMRSIGGS